MNTDYFQDREYFDNLGEALIFTGKIDEFYDYEYGDLAYRGLSFHHEVLDLPDYQNNAVVNFTDSNNSFTRIIEHKHFEFGRQSKTVITKEYPKNAERKDIPFYPVRDSENLKKYERYKSKISGTKVIFGGRLGEYKYYDMHQVVASAINMTKKIGDRIPCQS